MMQKGAATMTTQTRTTTIIAIAIALLSSTGTAAAQAKKLYCWNEGGRKICGDALPPEAAQSARTEISEKSGLPTGQVPRALTDAERAAAAGTAAQAQAVADAEAARQRRDLAMVESYDSEADLRDAYGNRISLVEASLKASALGETNLRRSLASLLSQASDQELAGRPVGTNLLAIIRSQHDQLLQLQRIVQQQRQDRAALDAELVEALARYRAIKQPTIRTAPVADQPPPPYQG